MSREHSPDAKDGKSIELVTQQDLDEAKDRAHEKATHQGCCCASLTTLCYWFGCKCPCKCCCCDNDNLEDHGLDAIVKERHFTDIPCCCLMLFSLIAQLVLFVIALQNDADPRWLVYYSDWEGNLCAPGESHGSRAAWPDIRIYDIVICVDTCNDTQSDDRIVTPDFDVSLDDLDYLNGTLTYDITGYETSSFFGAYCLPSLSTIESIVDTSLSEEYQTFIDTYYDTIDTLGETLSLALDDLYTVRYIFIACAVNAFFVSLLWGYFMRHCGGVIVWCSILFTLFGVIVISYYMISFSETAYEFGYETIGDIMYYGGIVLGVGDGMFFLAICFMWHRIRLAIALAKETTRALNSMWGMFFYPALPFIVFLIYCAYWLVGALYMGSVTVEDVHDMPEGVYSAYYDGGETLYEALGSPTNATYIEYDIDPTWQYILLFHFFVFLWVIQFIVYHTYFVLAGIYAEWYFAEWKDYPEDTVKRRGNGQRELSHHPIWGSFWRTTIYHLGTLAFGSLLIAIVEFIEYTLTYFERKFRAGEPSPLQTAILCMIKCFLRCLKCILDRINRNGYIICAITGWPFCASSMKGISITFKNIVRSAALNMVSGYLEKLGKIAIISYNAAATMMLTYYVYNDSLSSLFLPTVICLLISWTVCLSYMQLYEVGLETIFICFLIDEQVNKDKQFRDENGNVIIHPQTGKPIGKMRASHRLYKLIGLKKPRIRASKRDVLLLKKGQRVQDENDEEYKKDAHMSGKSLKKIFLVDPENDEASSSEASMSLYSSTTKNGRDSDVPRPSDGPHYFKPNRQSGKRPSGLEMENRLHTATGTASHDNSGTDRDSD